jgi:hypothetical protein
VQQIAAAKDQWQQAKAAALLHGKPTSALPACIGMA